SRSSIAKNNYAYLAVSKNLTKTEALNYEMDEVDRNCRGHLVGRFLLHDVGGNTFKEYCDHGIECYRNELWPARLFQSPYDIIFCRFYTYSKDMGKTHEPDCYRAQ